MFCTTVDNNTLMLGILISGGDGAYTSVEVFVPSTRRMIISDTVEFLPTKIGMPATTILDKTLYAAQDLLQVLKQQSQEPPSLTFGKVQHTALQQLAEILEKSSLTQPSYDTSPKPRGPASVPRVPTVLDTTPYLPSTPRVPTPTPTPSPMAQNPNAPIPPTTLRRSPRLQQANTRRRQPQQALLARLSTKPQYRDFILNHVTKTINYIQQHIANPVLDQSSGKTLEFRDLINHPDPAIREVWSNAFCNELGRLTQGYKNQVQFTNCCKFIKHSEIPTHKKKLMPELLVKFDHRKMKNHTVFALLSEEI